MASLLALCAINVAETIATTTKTKNQPTNQICTKTIINAAMGENGEGFKRICLYARSSYIEAMQFARLNFKCRVIKIACEACSSCSLLKNGAKRSVWGLWVFLGRRVWQAICKQKKKKIKKRLQSREKRLAKTAETSCQW